MPYMNLVHRIPAVFFAAVFSIAAHGALLAYFSTPTEDIYRGGLLGEGKIVVRFHENRAGTPYRTNSISPNKNEFLDHTEQSMNALGKNPEGTMVGYGSPYQAARILSEPNFDQMSVFIRDGQAIEIGIDVLANGEIAGLDITSSEPLSQTAVQQLKRVIYTQSFSPAVLGGHFSPGRITIVLSETPPTNQGQHHN